MRGALGYSEIQGLTVNEVVLELEDHYFATMIIKIGSERTHQCMLHLGGNFDEDQDICIILKCLARDTY